MALCFISYFFGFPLFLVSVSAISSSKQSTPFFSRYSKAISAIFINQSRILSNCSLKDDNTHDYLASQSAGSANQANISKVDIENIAISIPPLNEQQAIAEVLSSLDDKIDLLHRQNKTLEGLAQTLFRHLFIQGADESFEMKSLGYFVEDTLGGEWGKENPEGDYLLQVQCIRGTDIADLETGISHMS